jgi:ABC-type dipeptide/oligopeptide/nickel transport system ATPase component
MPAKERLKLRGTAMSMVFQDPMSSLNPVFTIADQMGTILKYADKRLGRGRGRQASGWRACMRCWRRCGCAIPSGFRGPIRSSFRAACASAS